MTAADLARERDRTRREAWDRAPHALRLAICHQLGWHEARQWMPADMLTFEQRLEIADAALHLAPVLRDVSNVALEPI
jgi:hypothetical protein